LLVKDAITVGGRLDLEAMILKDGGLASSRTARAKSVRIFWSRVPRPLKRDRGLWAPYFGFVLPARNWKYLRHVLLSLNTEASRPHMAGRYWISCHVADAAISNLGVGPIARTSQSSPSLMHLRTLQHLKIIWVSYLSRHDLSGSGSETRCADCPSQRPGC
jgi:hypothetical protein